MADPRQIDVKLSERQADRLVLGVSGDLDHSSVAAFVDRIGALQQESDLHLVLDLSECEFCDSAGIGALARLMRQRHDSGGQVVLAGSRDNLARTLERTGLSQRIPNYPTVPDALSALPGPMSQGR